MAKVEMSLTEYNAMKEELDFLNRVVREITTPAVDEWNMNYCRSNSTSMNGYASLTPEVEAYLKTQIEKNIPEVYRTEGFSSEITFSNPSLINLKYDQPNPEEVSDEDSGN